MPDLLGAVTSADFTVLAVNFGTILAMPAAPTGLVIADSAAALPLSSANARDLFGSHPITAILSPDSGADLSLLV